MRRNGEKPVENMEHFLYSFDQNLQNLRITDRILLYIYIKHLSVLSIFLTDIDIEQHQEELLERSQFSSVPFCSVAPSFFAQHLQQTLTYFAMSFTAARK